MSLTTIKVGHTKATIVLCIFTAVAAIVLFISKSWPEVSYSRTLLAGMIGLSVIAPLALILSGTFKTATKTEIAVFYPLMAGLVFMFCLPLVNLAVIKNTGDIYEYTAKATTVREYKVQRVGNSSFQCPHTVYWWDARHEKYFYDCTSKTAYQQYKEGKPVTLAVKVSSHFGGHATRVLETRTVTTEENAED